MIQHIQLSQVINIFLLAALGNLAWAKDIIAECEGFNGPWGTMLFRKTFREASNLKLDLHSVDPPTI